MPKPRAGREELGVKQGGIGPTPPGLGPQRQAVGGLAIVAAGADPAGVGAARVGPVGLGPATVGAAGPGPAEAGMASVGTETQGGASAGPQPQGAAGAVAAVRTGEPG